ncbi:DoxX family protein [Arthrobacter sp. NPDC056727]|uniref:DoxX family protein n=1 Tax=Arthrobacter sp. NPDC056727 TaxID=3345927 RepID=UPI0036727C5D
MTITLWIIAGLLALAFFAAGSMKIAQPKEKLASSGQPWVEDFSPGAVKVVGLLEVVGALGLIVPALAGIATILVPAAAAGLALLMIGAAIVHARRGEYRNIGANVVLAGLALFLAIARFGPYGF